MDVACTRVRQYYTSPQLALDLLRRGVYTCGTLNAKRSGWPKQYVMRKKDDMGAGRVMTLGRMSVASVVDVGVVTFLSTIHDVKREGSVKRWDPKQRRRRLFHTYFHHQDYNKHKGVVDGWNAIQVRRVLLPSRVHALPVLTRD